MSITGISLSSALIGCGVTMIIFSFTLPRTEDVKEQYKKELVCEQQSGKYVEVDGVFTCVKAIETK